MKIALKLVERYLINMRPEPVELLIILAQILLGVWFIFTDPLAMAIPFKVLTLLFNPVLFGIFTVLFGMVQIASAILDLYTIRKYTSFVSSCAWTFIALSIAFNPVVLVPPFCFIFAVAAGWTYIKLTRDYGAENG